MSSQTREPCSSSVSDMQLGPHSSRSNNGPLTGYQSPPLGIPPPTTPLCNVGSPSDGCTRQAFQKQHMNTPSSSFGAANEYPFISSDSQSSRPRAPLGKQNTCVLSAPSNVDIIASACSNIETSRVADDLSTLMS